MFFHNWKKDSIIYVFKFMTNFGHNPIFDDPKIMVWTIYQNGVGSHEMAPITQLWAS